MARTKATARVSTATRRTTGRRATATAAAAAKAADQPAAASDKDAGVEDTTALLAKIAALTAQFEEERRLQRQELEWKLAHQREQLLATMTAPAAAAAASSSSLPSSVAASSCGLESISEAMTETDCSEAEERKESDSDAILSQASGSASSTTTSAAAQQQQQRRLRLEVSAWSDLDETAVAYPSDWPAHQSHHVVLQNIEAESEEWQRIHKMLVDGGLPNVKLQAIQRIFNRPLWARYYLARQRVMQKHGNSQYNNHVSYGNEKLLWHGTRGTSPLLIYAGADGFDVRCASMGMLGAGMYFSSSSQYSGTSYAHPLNTNGNYYYGPQTKPSVSIPPVYTTKIHPQTGQTTLQAKKLPANTMQMFLARVTLGHEFDTRLHGTGFRGGRAPIRPFECDTCAKVIDLEKLNLQTLKATLVGVASVDDVIEEAEETAAKKATKAAASSTAAPAKKKAGKRKKADEWGPSTKKKRRVKAAPAAPNTPVAVAVTATVDASQTDDIVTLPDVPAAAAASSPSADPTAAAAASSITVAPSPPPPAPVSFEHQAVHCPHCKSHIGTRGSLLATQYRYDSVGQDHMHVTYESDRAYPEFLITFQP